MVGRPCKRLIPAVPELPQGREGEAAPTGAGIPFEV
jgi:hypothetical protein